MTKKKQTIALLISSQKGLDSLQPIVSNVITNLKSNIQLDFYSQSGRDALIRRGQREKNFAGLLVLADIVLVDLTHTSPATFFDIGIARAIGKPIIFIAEEVFLDELPDFIRQNIVLIYHSKEQLEERLRAILIEFLKNPKIFTPRGIIKETSSQIVVDLEKLDMRDFENLCFELLARLGYKNLEWRLKDELIDAVTTLKKQDPDGFEYDEFWLISFRKEYMKDELLDMAIHDPEYFIERIFRNVMDSDMIGRTSIKYERDVPITLLLILRGKENHSKKLIREISRRDFRMSKRGFPFTMRIRWWDEQTITSLVQNNLPLARKYFSSDALTRSGVRLSYEELYNQYADTNEQLEITNQLLISERNKIEALERDAAWKLLSFTAAHRLGNPMDAIDSELSNLKLALEMGKKEMIEDIIKGMEVPVERAKSIVAEFRNLSVAQEIKPEIVSSGKLNELLKYSAKQAIDKGINVVFNLKNTSDTFVDIKKLSDCFDELVKNSMHFINGDKQQITISFESTKKTELPDKIDRTKKYVKITFADNGCGVPFEKKKDIFKPFERSYVHGTGLGLASCESIVEEHGGKIREIGKPNEGAVFEIFLPIFEKESKD